jgi:MarR family transcriptional regulator, organic hydroperoxide resistance regulator
MVTNKIAIDRRVLRDVERLGQRTGRYVQDRLAHLDTTDLEVHVLWHLRKSGRPVADLQQAFGIQPSTLTGVLDRLEKRGLARRELNPQDRRSFRVVLTPAGRRSAEAVRGVLDGFEAHIRRKVSAAELDGFFAVVDAIDEVMSG